MKIFLDTYGCTANHADSGIIRAMLDQHSFTGLEDSEIVIVNSCGVKNLTESKVVSSVKRYLSLGKRVIVAGCLPRVNPRVLKGLDVGLVDTNSLDRFPEAVSMISAGTNPEFFSEARPNKARMPHFIDDSASGIIEISDGCLGNCAFCGTKNARGSLTSYPLPDIISRAECLLMQGKEELLITSQDDGCYGFDIGTSLLELMQRLTALEGKFRMRVGMMNPGHALKLMPGLLDVFKSEKVYKFAHLPVQSGSDRVLKEMNRAHTAGDFEELAGAFREVPSMVISTDMIVGFPTETDDDFQQSMELIRRVKPDVINISKFYARPGTAAAGMKKIDTRVIKQRSVEMRALCRQVILEQNEKYVGKKLECLVTGTSKNGQVLARAPNFKQVMLDEEAAGFITANIIDAGPTYLRGKVINTPAASQ